MDVDIWGKPLGILSKHSTKKVDHSLSVEEPSSRGSQSSIHRYTLTQRVSSSRVENFSLHTSHWRNPSNKQRLKRWFLFEIHSHRCSDPQSFHWCILAESLKSHKYLCSPIVWRESFEEFKAEFILIQWHSVETGFFSILKGDSLH